MCLCVCVCVCVCVCTYIHTYIHMYIYIHAYSQEALFYVEGEVVFIPACLVSPPADGFALVGVEGFSFCLYFASAQ
jgi:hypothetical protein